MSVSQYTSSSHTIILASAGSGKTYRLTLEYIRLLLAECLNNESLDSSRIAGQILATTFTRKAAAELQQRILFRLSDAAINESAYQKLIDELNQLESGGKGAESPLQTSDYGQMTQARLLSIVCHLSWRLDRLKMVTLDSFFQKLCGAFSHYLELPDSEDLSLVVTSEDDPRLKRLRYAALRDVLDSKGRHTCLELLQRLNHQRGKRSIQQALDSIVTELSGWYKQVPGQTGWQQLSVPATPLPNAAKVKQAIDTLAAHANKTYANRKQLRNSVLANTMDAGRGDWEAFISKGIAQKIDAGDTTYYKKEIDSALIAYFQPLLAHARHELLSQQKNYLLSVYQLLHAFSGRYSHLRYDAGLILFDDFPYQLFHHFEGIEGYTSEIMYRLDTQVRHILLDEHQDTSLLQWQILKPFLGEIAAVTDGSRTLVAVGDRKQAIYGWRGGESEIFDLFESELHLSRENWITISRNFRSSQYILDACNQVFTKLTGDNDPFNVVPELRAVARAWEARYPLHEANDPDRPGMVSLLAIQEPEEDVPVDTRDPQTSDGHHKEESHFDLQAYHLATKVAFIQRLYEKAKDRQFATSESTIGVLCSNNKTAASILYQLKQCGLPAESETGRLLAEDPGVMCLLSLLILIDHPGDSAAAFRVYHSPLKVATKLGPPGSIELRLALRRLRFHIATEGLQRVLFELSKALLSAPNVQSDSLNQLIELAGEFDKHHAISSELRLNRFVELAFHKEFPAESGSTHELTGPKIQVMTIHKSKGLEFTHVVLPDLDGKLAEVREDILPKRDREIENPAALYSKSNKRIRALSREMSEAYLLAKQRRFKEDLCVLYVAMTRARETLWMISNQADPKSGAGLCFSDLLKYAFKSDTPVSSHKACSELVNDSLITLNCIGNWPEQDTGTELEQQGSHETLAKKPAVTYSSIILSRTPTRPVQSAKARHRPLESLFRNIAVNRPEPSSTLFESVSESPETKLSPLRRGLLWHDWFSQIEWLDETSPDWQTLKQLALDRAREEQHPSQPNLLHGEGGNELDLQIENEARAFLATLSQPALTSIFRKPGPNEFAESSLWRERDFAVILNGEFIRGRYDRVVIRPGSATIYDFKTAYADEHDMLDRVPPVSWLKAKVHDYEPQMAVYRDALAEMLQFGREQISAQLVFVQYGICVPVDIATE